MNPVIKSKELLAYCKLCEKENPYLIEDCEKLCTVCGLVIEKEIEWVQSFDYQSNSTQIDQTQLYDTRPGIKNYKDHGGKKVNYEMANSLKRTIQRTKTNNTIERTKFKGILECERIVRLLDLPAHIESQILKKFLQFNKAGHLKNKNTYSCIAGLIYITCNKNNIPLSLNELLKNSVVNKKKFNADYFYLYHLYESAGPTSAKVEAHLKKYLSNVISWSNYDKFCEELDQCVKVVDLHSKFGRQGMVTSGTLIYALLRHYKYPHIENVLSQLNINRLTLKNCWKNLLEQHSYLRQYETTCVNEDLDSNKS